MKKKKKQSLQRVVRNKLFNLYDNSDGSKPTKHEWKKENGFKKSPYIHSLKSLKTYEEFAKRYIDWCIKEKGVDPYGSMEDLSKHAEDYLIHRNESGKSKHTIKTERAALGKILNRPVEFDITSYNRTEITRSRGYNGSRNFRLSEVKNERLIAVAKATGGRKGDLEKLRFENFKEINGYMYVEFNRSKGGRDRISPVVAEYQDYIRDLVKSNPAPAKLFSKIPTHSDIHEYRRWYSGALYNDIKGNPELNKKIRMDCGWPDRKDYPSESEIESEIYHSRRGKGFSGLRDDIYVVSQALGHNRLGISVASYLT